MLGWEGAVMIMDALVLIKSELNDYIKRRLNLSDDQVFLSSIVDGNGSSASADDVVTMTLAHIEEECVNKAQQFNQVRHDTKYTYSQPEILLNLFIIVSVRPNQTNESSASYKYALARLSMAAHFFQSRRYFDRRDIQSPDISDALRRVIVELHSSGFEQQSYIWGIHGGHYLPSLMYKVSVIHILEGATTREVPAVETIELEGQGGGL